MKKGIWTILTFISILIFILWASSPITITYLVNFLNEHSVIDFPRENINIYYVSIGALFTALAFLGTISAILIQQSNLSKQTSFDVIKNVLNKVQNDKKYIEAIDYILEELPSILIILQDNVEVIGSKEIKSKTKSGFNHLLYFCRTMEYIGIVAKNKYVEEKILIQYLGKTIIETFNILFPILKVDIQRLGNNAPFYFVHYRYLYYLAVNNKDVFITESNKSIKKYERVENKMYKHMEEKKMDFEEMVVYDCNNSIDINDPEDVLNQNCYCDSCDGCDS